MSDDMPRICVDCEWTDVQDLWEPVARRVLVRPFPQRAPNPALLRQFSEGGWVRPAIIPSPADDAAPPHTIGTPADWVREGEERAIREWAEEGQW